MADTDSPKPTWNTTPNAIIRVGDRFGRLVALSEGHMVQRAAQTQRFIPVRCDCGSEKDVRASSLKDGVSTSCGCFKRELLAANATMLAKHGHSRKDRKTPEYRSWCSMKSRCSNPNVERYPLYGGRGITVCEQWQGKDGFANFVAHMGLRPDGMSIERRDTNGDYEPGNCYWAGPKVQANNTTRNRILECGGRSMTIAQWSEGTGIKAATIHRRIKCGWPVDKAINTPVRHLTQRR